MLQRSSKWGPWWKRWGRAFDGLHLLMGYATTYYDNPRGGRILARRALCKGWHHGLLAIDQAFAIAAEHQPYEHARKVVWSVMGVIGPHDWADYNDHFWRHGHVGPDIRGADKKGYWIVWGPA